MTGAAGQAAAARIAALLAPCVGPDELCLDARLRDLFAADIFYRGRRPAAVLRPRSIDRLAAAVATATAAGIAVVPRGGGLSYSAGFVTDRDDVLLVDLRGLDAIGDIDETAGSVTVQAGCSWRRLHQHLRPRGLRTRFWGVASGAVSTIGGALSQEAALFGAARHGTAGDSVLAMTIVAADGRLVHAPGTDGGVADFIGDCGALGLKVEAVLPLERVPLQTSFAAFRFAAREAALAALRRTGRSGEASECFLFDRCSTDQRRPHDDGERLVEPRPGQRHRADAMFELHAAFEADDAAEIARRHAAFAATCGALGGTPIGDGALSFLHRTPFGAPTLLVGPGGRRSLPTHFIVETDTAGAMLAEIERCMVTYATTIRQHDITWSWSAAAIGTDHVLLEPFLYWRDAQPPQVTSQLDAAFLDGRPRHAADPAAAASVQHLRAALIATGASLRARHMQVGRIYPRSAAFARWTEAELLARKRRLDPHGRINPGVLGLGSDRLGEAEKTGHRDQDP